ncbi:hypothetical protein [Lacticaseibacillus hulanensis]|jgi:hypothetical protein|uniref:hypothetical protein n=1 Tax=Lacticaseibacillus hulanensis TaxID=2493111 RepID=UPI000FD8B7E5|nr:hypothetical protein [Lacticaseibacillus hulanensis]
METKEPINSPALRFIGRAYTEAFASENGSYQEAWDEFTDSGAFAKLDAQTDKPNRSSLVVFSPYGSMVYWIGSVMPADTPVPAGLQKYDLPAYTVARLAKKSTMMLTAYPVEVAIQQGSTALDMAGFQLPEYIGQTAAPYYVERYNLNDGKVAEVEYTVYVGADKDYGFDDID